MQSSLSEIFVGIQAMPQLLLYVDDYISWGPQILLFILAHWSISSSPQSFDLQCKPSDWFLYVMICSANQVTGFYM